MNEIININNVNAYLGKDGIAYLKLEDVARGLGITKERWISKTKETILDIRWDRLEQYCSEFGLPLVGKDDFIPENIFYKLCMKANNEVARKFQDLVCDEILPSIRKNGIYATTETIEQMLGNPDFGIKLLTTLKEEKEKNKELETKIGEMKPKEVFADAVSVSDDCILVGDLAKLLNQNGIDIGQNRLFALLRENDYLISRMGDSYNMPTQKSMDLKLFKIKERTIISGDKTKIQKTPKVTGKGQQYFINLFLSKKVS